MFRYSFFTDLQVKLAQLVREEMLHYEQVLEFMAKRGQTWQGLSAGRYAQVVYVKKSAPMNPKH